jgi:hypothetical protein
MRISFCAAMKELEKTWPETFAVVERALLNKERETPTRAVGLDRLLRTARHALARRLRQ